MIVSLCSFVPYIDLRIQWIYKSFHHLSETCMSDVSKALISLANISVKGYISGGKTYDINDHKLAYPFLKITSFLNLSKSKEVLCFTLYVTN